MDIPINVEVICCDGNCGRSTHVILNPKTEQVTHVVVQEYALSDDRRLVPVDQIIESTPQKIHVRLCKDDLEQMEHFTEAEFIQAAYPHGFWYASSAEPPVFILEHELVPEGEEAIDRGARVVASDGPIGHVDEFLIDPVSQHITHLILREGHFWGQKEVTIPVNQIERIEEDTVYLKLSKEEIERLPKKPMPKKHPDDTASG